MKDFPELMLSDLLLSVMCTALNLLSISYSLCSYLAHCLKIKESVSVWLLSLEALMRVYYSGVPYPPISQGMAFRNRRWQLQVWISASYIDLGGTWHRLKI